MINVPVSWARRHDFLEGRLEVAEGDRIQARVVSTTGGLTLSRRGVMGAATAQQLEDAYRARLPVEGKVERAVKGGYEVRVARQRAFCPFSQIDIIRNTEPAQHEGRTYRFLIIEYKEGGRNLVVSRRTLLEEEQRRCIVLAFVEGLSHSEVAQRVRAPLGSVKSWIRRGLLSLRRCLQR